MPINRIYPRIPTEGIMPIRPRYFSRKEKASFFRSLKSLSFTTLSFYSARQDMHFVIRMSLCFSTVYKVIHPRYSKHWLAAAMDFGCSTKKWNHGLNFGLFIYLFKVFVWILSSTCALTFFFFELSHVIYLKLTIVLYKSFFFPKLSDG